jgi:hypothetical protein
MAIMSAFGTLPDSQLSGSLIVNIAARSKPLFQIPEIAGNPAYVFIRNGGTGRIYFKWAKLERVSADVSIDDAGGYLDSGEGITWDQPPRGVAFYAVSTADGTRLYVDMGWTPNYLQEHT